MIELTCPTCQQVFERRGLSRGGRPLDCNACRDAKEQERIRYKPGKKKSLNAIEQLMRETA